MTAHEALSAALAELLENDRRTPCAGSSAWISDSRDERAAVAELCHGCPILTQCRSAGADEITGVWGGIDRTPHRTNARKAS